jgi:hypothetical protein
MVAEDGRVAEEGFSRHQQTHHCLHRAQSLSYDAVNAVGFGCDALCSGVLCRSILYVGPLLCDAMPCLWQT